MLLLCLLMTFFCTVQYKEHEISNKIMYEAVCIVLKDTRNWVLESVAELLNESRKICPTSRPLVIKDSKFPSLFSVPPPRRRSCPWQVKVPKPVLGCGLMTDCSRELTLPYQFVPHLQLRHGMSNTCT